MIRAVIFDFYGVVVPDIFSDFIRKVSENSDVDDNKLKEQVNKYYLGLENFDYITNALEYISATQDFPKDYFRLLPEDISPNFIKLVKKLHLHFLKVAIVGNMGSQAYEMLTNFDKDAHEFDLIASPSLYGEDLLSEQFFISALNELGAPLDSCLLISNNQAYLNFATKIKMQTRELLDFDSLNDYVEKLV